MLSLHHVIALLAALSIFSVASNCDSSYYDKYYAARKYYPLKRNAPVEFNFSLILEAEDKLAEYERVAIVGDHEKFGFWNANNSILMNRTENNLLWEATVQIPQNTSIMYRYFIAAVSKEGAIQVKRWETALEPRSLQITTKTGRVDDVFGRIVEGGKKEIQNGWLNSGSIVQFKIFKKALHMNDSIPENREFYLKMDAIDYYKETEVLPSARANIEYVKMIYGDSFLKVQPQYGVKFDNQNDIIIFHTTLAGFDVGFSLKVYAADTETDTIKLVAIRKFYPCSLKSNGLSEGNLVLDLYSPVWGHVVGTLNIGYLTILPLPNNTQVSMHTTFVDYWRPHWNQMDLGHRGLGKSLKLTAANAPPLIENTVASMKASAELGAEFVEFDVMLTKDLVPIINHDYYVYVCLEAKTPTSLDDLTQVLIKDVTYEQLKDLITYQVVSNKLIEYASHNSEKDEDNRLFPLFSDFLTKVNKSVGFDIEIKFPQLKLNGQYESNQTIDKNLYIDRILQVMYEHGCGRFSFFTCFDADTCSMLRYKQNMYPVMFLQSSAPAFADPRADTIYDSVNNAQAFDLAGIVPNANRILKDPELVKVALNQNKKIFLWGDDLKDEASIAWFKEQNVTGVIYDRLDLWLPKNKTSIFDAESDLPQLFEKQCNPKLESGSRDNATAYNILSNVNML